MNIFKHSVSALVGMVGVLVDVRKGHQEEGEEVHGPHQKLVFQSTDNTSFSRSVDMKKKESVDVEKLLCNQMTNFKHFELKTL